jgi:hypothetical protein
MQKKNDEAKAVSARFASSWANADVLVVVLLPPGDLIPARYLVEGKLNTAPSRTPAEGQRCVIAFRFV